MNTFTRITRAMAFAVLGVAGLAFTTATEAGFFLGTFAVVVAVTLLIEVDHERKRL